MSDEAAAAAAATTTTTLAAVNNSQSLSISPRRRIHWVCVTKEAFVVVYLIDEQLLCTYTINGRLLATKDIRERLFSIIPSEDGQVLLTGGENCLVIFRWVRFFSIFIVFFFCKLTFYSLY